MTLKPLKIILLSLPTIVIAVFILFMALYLKEENEPESFAVKPLSKALPIIDLVALQEGETQLTSDIIKQTGGLINIFASWCIPCHAEHPLLMELKEKYNIPIYGINWKDAPDQAKKMILYGGNPYQAIGQDPDGLLALHLGITGIPETYVVNKQGMITHKVIGPLNKDLIEQELLPLLL